jgi:hypothetical protein
MEIKRIKTENDSIVTFVFRLLLGHQDGRIGTSKRIGRQKAFRRPFVMRKFSRDVSGSWGIAFQTGKNVKAHHN